MLATSSRSQPTSPLFSKDCGGTGPEMTGRATSETLKHIHHHNQQPLPLCLPEPSLLLDPKPPVPQTQELHRPENFGVVCEGVYRSGWLEEEDLPFIESLHLKTIVYVLSPPITLLSPSLMLSSLPLSSLVFEEYPETHLKLCSDSGITRHVFGIHGHKVPQGDIPVQAIGSALSIILDRRNHPVLVHCNGGKVSRSC